MQGNRATRRFGLAEEFYFFYPGGVDWGDEELRFDHLHACPLPFHPPSAPPFSKFPFPSSQQCFTHPWNLVLFCAFAHLPNLCVLFVALVNVYPAISPPFFSTNFPSFIDIRGSFRRPSDQAFPSLALVSRVERTIPSRILRVFFSFREDNTS
jgi:hypothetical protein